MLSAVWPAHAALTKRVRDPYMGALVVDAADGRVIFEDRADGSVYPASVLKLMTLLVVLDYVEQGKLRLSDPVVVTAQAARMGGSQVYLKEGETFTVDELLYALMIQSANDAATALALHVAGTKEAFAGLMNARARELGMTNTVFRSVHGLPPGKDQEPDVTTPRDMARLAMAVARRPEVFRYTSVRERGFRDGTFVMRTHNNLLGDVPGCDGFKTGYYRAAGYSIVATASRDGARAIAIVMGSPDKQTRDREARALLSRGLLEAVRPPPAPAPTEALEASSPPPVGEPAGEDQAPSSSGTGRAWRLIATAVVAVVTVAAGLFLLRRLLRA